MPKRAWVCAQALHLNQIKDPFQPLKAHILPFYSFKGFIHEPYGAKPPAGCIGDGSDAAEHLDQKLLNFSKLSIPVTSAQRRACV